MRIEITPFDLEFEKDVDAKEFYLDLHENKLVFKIDMIATHPVIKDDWTSGETTDRVYANVVAFKSDIAGVMITYVRKTKIFRIDIEFKGLSEGSVKFYVQKEIEALDIFRKIEDWIFNK